MPTAKHQPTTPHPIEPGQWVLIFLQDSIAPWASVCGEVQAVDDNGIRVTIIDWSTRKSEFWDFFVQWVDIRSVIIATPQHDIEQFKEYALEMQMRLNSDMHVEAFGDDDNSSGAAVKK